MKTIVITGATSGIGNLILKDFIAKGWRVFAGYRNIKLKKDLEKISPHVIPFRIDMSKKWSITDAVKFIQKELGEYGKIDVLVNAAGCVIAGPMENLNVDKIREQFEINTFSHLELTQGLFDRLEGGRIINISSTASFGIYPFIAPYCASKKALDILFNTLQLECGDCIKVISIKPGVIKTPLWEKSIDLNKDALGDCEKYQREFDYLMNNAKENQEKGLEAQKVADLIMKVATIEEPKPSYTIGLDAKIAEVISHLPQKWINKMVRKIFEKRLSY